jgi:uncharacterized protein involved in type VI secretion and phage assembly
MTSPLDEARNSQVLKVQITLNGSPISDHWELIDARVQLGLRAIGRATLVFADGDMASGTFEVLEGVHIGDDVVVEAGFDNVRQLFHGTITSVASSIGGHNEARTILTIQDGGYDLLRNADLETFTNLSLKDIVTRLVSGAGLTAGTIDLPTTPVKYAMRNDTVLGLIDEIAERTGRDWCITDRTFAMWPAATGGVTDSTSYTITYGIDVLAWQVKQTGTGTTKVTVRGWDPVAQSAVVGTSNSPSSRAAFDVSQPGSPTFERVDARAATRSQSDATLAAQAIAARTGRVVAKGKVQLAGGMLPGGVLTASGLGPANGEYYVREVTHDLADGNGLTEFVVGDRDPVQLSDPWNENAPVSSFKRSGLAVGIVDNVQDPDKLGRVSVSLSTASDQATSAWARVLSLGAGSGRGQVVIPEVGDEVLIGFEDDDVTRPVVLGGLFGSTAKSPTEAVDANGAVVTRALTSRLGHSLIMSDGTTPATQHVQLAIAGLEHALRIGKDRADLKVPSGIPLKITSGSAFIEFDGNGGIVIDATTIKIKATSKVEITATDVEAKANAGLKLQGTQASLKGTGMGVVEAGGILEVKGAMVKIN